MKDIMYRYLHTYVFILQNLVPWQCFILELLPLFL